MFQRSSCFQSGSFQDEVCSLLRCSGVSPRNPGQPQLQGLSGSSCPGMGTGVETVHVLTEESPLGEPYWVLQVTRNSRKAFTLALCQTQAPDQGLSWLSSHLCPQFKPLQSLDGCCQHRHHWQRSYSPWRAGDAVPCSMGLFPWGVVSHSPEPCPEPVALPVGKRGGG